MEEVGLVKKAKVERGDKEPSWMANAQRNAWRTFKRVGVGWKVPLSTFEFDTGEGEVLMIPYISPKSCLEFLLANVPDVLVGGVTATHEFPAHLSAFWAAYQQCHGTHAVFSSADTDLSYTLPLVLHGDEGRGKRRTGTLIIALESPLGLPDKPTSRKRKLHQQFDCQPLANHSNRFGCETCSLEPFSLRKLVSKMRTNNRHHSFLQRWPLIVIPGVVYTAFPTIVHKFNELLATELRSLFYEGVAGPQGRIFTAACIGLKADMKYHTKVGCLARSYEHKGRVRDLGCCHHCQGGFPNIPWEDVTETPIWEPTIYSERPWPLNQEPPLQRIPFDLVEPEAFYRTDPFHTGKVGALRDYVGSSLFWLIEHHYYGWQGDLPTKLKSAHDAFRSFCSATKATPALRSFSKQFFMYKSRKSFPWSNSKGSDTILLCRFLVNQVTGFIANPIKQEDVEILDLVKRCGSSGLAYYDRLYSHGLFPDRRCSLAIYLDGCRYIAGYCLLAKSCLGKCNLFAVKPKLHMWRHCLVEIRKGLARGSAVTLNPLAWGCEGNEDQIGRLAKLSRRLDSRGLSGRVLQCFLVKAHILHKRHCQSSEIPAVRPKASAKRRRFKGKEVRKKGCVLLQVSTCEANMSIRIDALLSCAPHG